MGHSRHHWPGGGERMREYQLGLGIPREQVYNQTMYILVGMLW
ncbi:hypothetical protein [Candidatus Aalborgicola defluviihabitans]